MSTHQDKALATIPSAFVTEEATSLTGGEYLSTLVHEEFKNADSSGTNEIRPSMIAHNVYCKIQPQPGATIYTECAAIMGLSQIVRRWLQRRQAANESEAESTQSAMFGNIQLQPWYPTRRDDNEPVYARLESLSIDELRFNSSRLRLEGRAKQKHADALDARALWLESGLKQKPDVLLSEDNQSFQ